MAERTPNARASYDAVETTPRFVGSPSPPTITGLPRSSGWRSTSTAAMNSSMSTWKTQRVIRSVWRLGREVMCVTDRPMKNGS